jgi:outer membrane protein assembly factor BamB
VSSTPVIAGDLVLAARAPGWLAAYDLADGTERWHQPLDDAWPVALTVAGDLAIVRSSTGRVTAHGLGDGYLQWRTDLGSNVRSARPYSRVPGGARLPIVIVGNDIWTATADAVVHLAVDSGRVINRVPADTEVATLARRDGAVVAVTVDAEIAFGPTARASPAERPARS